MPEDNFDSVTVAEAVIVLRDAQRAMEKARDLLRQARTELMTCGYTEGGSVLIAHITDLLGD